MTPTEPRKRPPARLTIVIPDVDMSSAAQRIQILARARRLREKAQDRDSRRGTSCVSCGAEMPPGKPRLCQECREGGEGVKDA